MADFNGTQIADTISGTNADDTILGLDGGDTINGAGGNDAINGGAGADNILGGDGDDTITGGDGEQAGDIIDGGDGDDTYVTTLAVNDDFVGAFMANGQNLSDFINIEFVAATNTGGGVIDLSADSMFALDETITSDDAVAVFMNDIAANAVTYTAATGLIAAPGGFTIKSINGADVTANEVITLNSGSTVTVGGALANIGYTPDSSFELLIGDDFVSTDDILDATLSVVLTDGTNEVTSTVNLMVNPDKDVDASAETTATSLIGDAQDNDITGGDGNDFIRGGDGDDQLDGGAGDDMIFAGPGDTGGDTIFGGDGNDIIGGGAGEDFIDGEEGDDTIFGGAGNDDIYACAGSDTVYGGDGDDLIEGEEADDILGGGNGEDEIYGGDGNDVIYGGADDSDDLLSGDAGDDIIFGGAGEDILLGEEGSDTIFNGAGDDVVSGGDGADILWGGAGDDLFFDLLGPDCFDDVFMFAAGNGNDVIFDFELDPGGNGVIGDVLNLTAFNFADTQSVIDAISDVLIAGPGTTSAVIAIAPGQTIRLEGLLKADMQAATDDWVLV